jgi:hypothetical protein
MIAAGLRPFSTDLLEHFPQGLYNIGNSVDTRRQADVDGRSEGKRKAGLGRRPGETVA